MVDPSAIRQRLKVALERWEQSVGTSMPLLIEANRSTLIATLTLIAKYEPGGVKRAFRTADRRTTEKELWEIADRGGSLAEAIRDPKRSSKRKREQLAARLENMHRTTINALAAASFISISGEQLIINIGAVRRDLPQSLRDDFADTEQLATVLDLLAQVAGRAVAPDTEDEGRWQDRRAQIVANILARFYQEATGRPPTISTYIAGEREGKHYGPFLNLVAAIFSAMNIKRQAYSFARDARRLCDG